MECRSRGRSGNLGTHDSATLDTNCVSDVTRFTPLLFGVEYLYEAEAASMEMGTG